MLKALKCLETTFGKRKLIVCFAVVIILAIGFLYYESIYNLNNRFKPFSQVTNKPDTKNLENTSQEKDVVDIALAKTDVLKDNSNTVNKSKCWEMEKFEVLEACSKCDLYSLKFLVACKGTGYKELIACEKYGHVSRSCSTPKSVLANRYWSFEFICLVMTGIFSSFVTNRKSYLDKIAMDRMRQQILS